MSQAVCNVTSKKPGAVHKECPEVTIIILNWNGWRDTVDCLDTILAIGYPRYNTIIVDNGSTDDSVVEIKKWVKEKCEAQSEFSSHEKKSQPVTVVEYNRREIEINGGFNRDELSPRTPSPGPLTITIIRNEKNYGFAEGNNIGINYALGKGSDYILLLNNDTTVDSNFLYELVRIGEVNSRVGIVGPKIYVFDEPNRIWAAGGTISWWCGKTKHRFANEVDRGQAEDVKSVEYVTGCALLIKRKVVEEIGLLDREYFAYFEDADWCLRANRKGYLIYYVPSSNIWHKISSTSILQSDFYNYYFARNRLIFFRKYGRKIHRLFIYAYQILIKSMAAYIIFGLKDRSARSASAYFRGCIDGLRYKTVDQ